MTNNKLYSLVEFRNKIYEELELSRSDLAILLCAMLIASIGLNMDSTPVIIGAMLISPLMTPILGVGLSLAIFDFKLLRKSFKILAIQILASLIASTLYFYLSPISYASSEIVARTSPTIWDVLIAFVGGIAGIIGARKKETNNIVPGVAIATALMPPLCTVGYAIASANLKFIIGSSYLFLINCSFIVIATYIGVRLMMVKKHYFRDNEEDSKMRRILLLVAVLLMIPSFISATTLVRETLKKESLNKFISEQFQGHNILKKTYSKKTHTLKLTISGNYLTEEELDMISSKRGDYGLSDVSVQVSQLSDSEQLSKEELVEYFFQYIKDKEAKEKEKANKFDTESEEQ
ncbi:MULTISPECIES: TIGR00341 family protein [Streptococcus]|uniref:TIGR00341 family protein n=1 Tax=Streptococcus TaxID=1301 RepID=UPI0005E05E86|nr:MULTISPECIES: TIGR00341 family protein [Streptococcus]CKI39947.1 membrane protein [Streptococcus pneumoniae]CKI62471.1 membrane protein [Streptococcus pneumoniae]CKI84170.1 membrane protein [Streptococcus pneumoniae]CKI86166.1 membrane protein [Streptococcus pneumoniae]CKI95679.1 membrane protein [Streptococcus pneumoniae]